MKSKVHTGRRGGGARKVPKKCHILFEWPLTHRLGTEGSWGSSKNWLEP